MITEKREFKMTDFNEPLRNGPPGSGLEKIKRAFMAALALLAVLFFAAPGARAADSGASGVIGRFNSALLEAMKKADELGYKGRYGILAPVIKDSFDMRFMASQSAGRYWAAFTGPQQNRLVDTFTDWTIATYANRFDGYSGEKFRVESETAFRDGMVAVISKLIKADNGEVVFHYILRKSGDAWRIIDIRISGVSQLALTRAQFSDVLKSKGLDGLIADLRAKIREYAGEPRK